MKAKAWYELHKDDDAHTLVAMRQAGATWASLEREFGLDPQHGQSAIRVYTWCEGKPKHRPAEATKLCISLDREAMRNLRKAKRAYGTIKASRAIQIALREAVIAMERP